MDLVVCRTTETGCWEVISHRPAPDGVPRCRRGKSVMPIPRAVYLDRHPGTTPEAVEQTCGNKMCVNPEHLVVGIKQPRIVITPKLRGDKHGRAKLNDEIVADILADHQSTNGALAKKWGVDTKVIWQIRNGKTWLHVPRGQPEKT